MGGGFCLHVFLILYLCVCLQVFRVEGQCEEPVDIVIELEHGLGTITRDIDGNYDVKILPGESMSLMCQPSCVDGEYQWKRGETVLYSSTNGKQILESDPEYEDIRFEPGSPSKWDEVWRLVKSDMEEDEMFSYSCVSSVYGQSNVNVHVTYDAIDIVQISFTGEGKFSDDERSLMLQYDECNKDLTQGRWSSFGDYCVLLKMDRLTYEAAEAQCREYGAELTSIHSGDENEFHVGILESSGLAADAWIGLQDRDDDETYEFTDGTPVDYTAWKYLEPEWGGRDLCVYLTIDFDDWIDNPCENTRPYFCKKPKDGTGSQPVQATFPTIACTFFGETAVSSVTWYKEDVQLTGPDYPTEETDPGRTYELSLTKGINNGGNYKCVADNGREGELWVKVDIPTMLSSFDEKTTVERSEGAPNKIKAKEGDNITITCTSELLPENPTLKWFKSSFANESFGESIDVDGTIVSQNLENNEWTLTLIEVSADDAGIYSCVSFEESGALEIGVDSVYVTVFTEAARNGDLEISLFEPATGVTFVMAPGQQSLPVSRGVGDITLICRSSFWADEIQWLNEYGSELYDFQGYVHETTIPGWERTVTFEFRGRYLSDGPHTCRARDSSTGKTLQKTIEIVTVATTNINLNEDGRAKYIEKRTPGEENIIVVFEGDTLSLTCTAKYPDDEYFKYLTWAIGSNEFFATQYKVQPWDEEYGRLSFTEDKTERTSTMTFMDVRQSDAKLIKCGLSDFPSDVVQLVVAQEISSCPNSCYPETGDWSGSYGTNCFNDSLICDDVAYCPTLVDEQDCPALGCGGLVKPENAYIFVSSYSFGSVATYSCKHGYVPVDEVTLEPRVCQENGQWSGQQPTCVLNIAGSTGCPRLASPEDGNLFCSGNKFGDTCFVKCNTGFSLYGDSERTCQDNGEWSGEPATCGEGQSSDKVLVSLVRGDAVSVKEHTFCYSADNCYDRTVFTVRKDAGPITFSCRYPSKTAAPYWRAGDGHGLPDPGTVVGDYSVSETIKDLEWEFTMGISEDGPLLVGSQTVFECQTEQYNGRFRIDVIGDIPFADVNTTKATITVSDGIKVEEVVEQPIGGDISYIQVNPGSTVSFTCAVTAPGAMMSDKVAVEINKETPWGDGSYNSEFPIAQNDYLWLSSGAGEQVSIKEDRRNSEWTLKVGDITEKWNVILTCKVRPHWENKDEFVVAKAHITVQEIPEYRRDRKCGPDYLSPTGLEATCPGECCSTDGECGSTDEHCVTNLYKDYRDECSYGMSTVSDLDWKTSEESCVVLIKKKKTFHDARDDCVKLGATLSSIHSDEEQGIHFDWLEELGAKRAWIGLNDEDREGRFVNIDGTTNNFEFWARKEPKDETGEEDCTHLKLSDDGKWKSTPCTDTMSYFCRRPRTTGSKLVRPTWEPTTVDTGEGGDSMVTYPSGIFGGSCETLDVLHCADLGYEYTYLPNFVNVSDQTNASSTLQQFGPLIQLGCSPDLKEFLCSIFAPKCTLDKPIPEFPSKEKCESARSGCEPFMIPFGYTWPEFLNCETLPTIEHLGSGGEGVEMGHGGSTGGGEGVEVGHGGSAGGETTALSIEVTSAQQPYTETEIAFPGFGTLKQIEVTKGDTISLTCTGPSDEDLAWSRESGPVSYGDSLITENPNIQLNVDPSKRTYTLTIEGVSDPDEGQWICGTLSGSIVIANLVFSGTNQIPSESASGIVVTSANQPYKETELQIPGFGIVKRIEVSEGDTISLTCRMPGTDGSVSWARESGPISYGDTLISENPNIQLHVDSAKSEWTLTIADISASEEGQWICGTPSGSLVTAELKLSETVQDPSLSGSQGPPVSGTCELLTVEGCSDLGYDYTYLPNFMNQTQQVEATQAMTSFAPLILSGCSPDLNSFLCSVLAPKCTTENPTPERPSKTTCQSVRQGCEPLFQTIGQSWPGFLSCERFRDPGEHGGETGIDETGRTPDEETIRDPSVSGPQGPLVTGTCELLTVEGCSDLGYDYTYLPNFMNQTQQVEATQMMTSFTPLILFGCSPDLKSFLCSILAPKCTPENPSPEFPSKTKCQSVRQGCEPSLQSFGQSWPEFLSCEWIPEDTNGLGEHGGETGTEGTGGENPQEGATGGVSIEVTANQPYTEKDIPIPGIGNLKQIEVTKGDTVSLTCTGPSDGDVTWARESGLVSFGSSLAITNPNLQLDVDPTKRTWTLTIQEFSDSDEGLWICGTLTGVQTMVNLTISDSINTSPMSGLSIRVSAAELPYLDKQISAPVGAPIDTMQQIIVSKGDTVSVTCTAPSQDKILWRSELGGISFDDTVLHDNPKISVDVDRDNLEWTFTITDVSEEYEGLYTCQSTNLGLQQPIAVASLALFDGSPPGEGKGQPGDSTNTSPMSGLNIRVSAAELPYLENQISAPDGAPVDSIQQIIVSKGDTVSLTCTAPSQDSILWSNELMGISFDDTLLHQDPKISLDVDRDNLEWTLTIKDVSEEYEGMYTCQSTNQGTTVVASLAIFGNLSNPEFGGPPEESPQLPEDAVTTKFTNVSGPDITFEIKADQAFMIHGEIFVPRAGTFVQLMVDPGTRLRMVCRSTPEAGRSIVWTHDNNPISFNQHMIAMDDNIEFEYGGSTWTVTIQEVSKSDEGPWTCAKSGGIDVAAVLVNITVSGSESVETTSPAPEATATISQSGEDNGIKTTVASIVDVTQQILSTVAAGPDETSTSGTEEKPRKEENNPEREGTCEPLSTALCSDLGYDETFLPNFVNLTSQDEAAIHIYKFSPLIEIGCSDNIKALVCSILAPKCISDGDEPRPEFPSKEICRSARSGCEPLMNTFGYQWPAEFECDLLPEDPTDDTGDCQDLTISFCSDLGYQYTAFPNFANQTSQDDANLELQSFIGIVNAQCSPDFKELLCSVYAPKCIPGSSTQEQPSRKLCHSARNGCEPFMNQFGYSWPEVLDCDTFPERNDTEEEEEVTLGECSAIGESFCSDLGYNYTGFPNYFNHTNKNEAMLELNSFYPIVKVECSQDFKPFICSLYLPVCSPGSNSLEAPSRNLCQSARDSCGPLMAQFGYAWQIDCELLPDDKDRKQPGEDETTVLQAKERRCQEILSENLELCGGLTYDATTMPNMFGHQTQEEIAESLATIMEEFPQMCLEQKQFICSTYLPACQESDYLIYKTVVPVLPCASVCVDAYSQCSNTDWPGPDVSTCRMFPQSDASYEKCWQPSSDVFGSSSGCEPVPSEYCRDLGFTFTKFPNKVKHENAEEALAAFNELLSQNLFRTGCSQEIAYFACGAIFPPCEGGEITVPCYEVCRRTWKDCKDSASDKHEIFRCGKYYPEYDAENPTCLQDMFPPSKTPTFADYGAVSRHSSSLEFSVGVDDSNVDNIHSTLYAISSPESRFVSSSSMALEVTTKGEKYATFTFGSTSQESQTLLLDAETSYIVVAQAQNRYGFGPMGLLVVPKFNEASIYPEVDDIGPSSFSERGVTVFRIPNEKQAICVNLMSDAYPVWFDEEDEEVVHKIIRRESEPQPYPEQSQLDVQGLKMTLLDIVTRRVGGPYQCGETATTDVKDRASVDLKSTATCFESTHFICKDFSKYTYLPNVFGHYDPQTAELASLEFLPLLFAHCADNATLAQFVCAAYAPDGSCDTTDLSEPRLPPCRETCESIQREYANCMSEIKFAWPHQASCDRFPSTVNGSCVVLSESGEEATNETSTLTPDTPDVSGPDPLGCGLKPRRYDVTGLGKDCYFRGWADVQGQGAANDYCRVISSGGGYEYLSCALAGLEGESEYNYNSPDPGEEWFEYGYEDTWYMKDEDDDGRDDYCRCVGKEDSYISCMKAGDTGFIGFYDFNITSIASPCNATKVNPFYGTPLLPPP